MDTARTREQIILPDADLHYFPHFLSPQQADAFFTDLQSQTPWQQDSIRMFGKNYLQPRLTALYAEDGRSYTYSGICMQSYTFTPELYSLKKEVEAICQACFNSCLLNLYRNGQDSNGWHADDEKELGLNPVIASVSLGQERKFQMKHKREKTLTYNLMLGHGSLFLMKGSTQHHWLHQLPKTRIEGGVRINLTFRMLSGPGTA